MHPEIRNGVEAARLLVRNPPKYSNGVKGLYMLSLADREVGRVARSSYFFMRHIDDVLDGDRTDIPNPLEYALDIRSQIESESFDKRYPITHLAKDALDILKRRATQEDNPKKDFLNELDIMIFDYERSQERRVFTQEELEQYYHDAFLPVINIMLVGLRSNMRASDIPELASSQGRVYSIRDLRDDWNRGLINIPGEVLQKASLSHTSSVPDVRASSVVHEWFREQLTTSREEIMNLQRKLHGSPEWLTLRMCNGLINPMVTFIDAFGKN